MRSSHKTCYDFLMVNSSAYAFSTLPRSLGKSLRQTVLVGLAISLSACSHLDYTLNRHNLNPHTAHGDQIAALQVSLTETSEAYQIPLKRVSGGYALEAPIYDQDGTTAHMEISKTREFNWFIGPKFSFAF